MASDSRVQQSAHISITFINVDTLDTKRTIPLLSAEVARGNVAAILDIVRAEFDLKEPVDLVNLEAGKAYDPSSLPQLLNSEVKVVYFGKKRESWKGVKLGNVSTFQVSHLPGSKVYTDGSDISAGHGKQPAHFVMIEFLHNSLRAIRDQPDKQKVIKSFLLINQQQPDKSYFVVTDHGYGMTTEETTHWARKHVDPNTARVTQDPNKHLPFFADGTWSKFGVGSKDSAFHLGDRVKVVTRKAGSQLVHEMCLDQAHMGKDYEFKSDMHTRNAYDPEDLEAWKSGFESSRLGWEKDSPELMTWLQEAEKEEQFTSFVIHLRQATVPQLDSWEKVYEVVKNLRMMLLFILDHGGCLSKEGIRKPAAKAPSTSTSTKTSTSASASTSLDMRVYAFGPVQLEVNVQLGRDIRKFDLHKAPYPGWPLLPPDEARVKFDDGELYDGAPSAAPTATRTTRRTAAGSASTSSTGEDRGAGNPTDVGSDAWMKSRWPAQQDWHTAVPFEAVEDMLSQVVRLVRMHSTFETPRQFPQQAAPSADIKTVKDVFWFYGKHDNTKHIMGFYAYLPVLNGEELRETLDDFQCKQHIGKPIIKIAWKGSMLIFGSKPYRFPFMRQKASQTRQGGKQELFPYQKRLFGVLFAPEGIDVTRVKTDTKDWTDFLDRVTSWIESGSQAHLQPRELTGVNGFKWFRDLSFSHFEREESVATKFAAWLEECHKTFDKEVHLRSKIAIASNNEITHYREWCNQGRVVPLGVMVMVNKLDNTICSGTKRREMLASLQHLFVEGVHDEDYKGADAMAWVLREPRDMFQMSNDGGPAMFRVHLHQLQVLTEKQAEVHLESIKKLAPVALKLVCMEPDSRKDGILHLEVGESVPAVYLASLNQNDAIVNQWNYNTRSEGAASPEVAGPGRLASFFVKCTLLEVQDFSETGISRGKALDQKEEYFGSEAVMDEHIVANLPKPKKVKAVKDPHLLICHKHSPFHFTNPGRYIAEYRLIHCRHAQNTRQVSGVTAEVPPVRIKVEVSGGAPHSVELIDISPKEVRLGDIVTVTLVVKNQSGQKIRTKANTKLRSDTVKFGQLEENQGGWTRDRTLFMRFTVSKAKIVGSSLIANVKAMVKPGARNSKEDTLESDVLQLTVLPGKPAKLQLPHTPHVGDSLELEEGVENGQEVPRFEVHLMDEYSNITAYTGSLEVVAKEAGVAVVRQPIVKLDKGVFTVSDLQLRAELPAKVPQKTVSLDLIYKPPTGEQLTLPVKVKLLPSTRPAQLRILDASTAQPLHCTQADGAAWTCCLVAEAGNKYGDILLEVELENGAKLDPADLEAVLLDTVPQEVKVVEGGTHVQLPLSFSAPERVHEPQSCVLKLTFKNPTHPPLEARLELSSTPSAPSALRWLNRTPTPAPRRGQRASATARAVQAICGESLSSAVVLQLLDCFGNPLPLHPSLVQKIALTVSEPGKFLGDAGVVAGAEEAGGYYKGTKQVERDGMSVVFPDLKLASVATGAQGALLDLKAQLRLPASEDSAAGKEPSTSAARGKARTSAAQENGSEDAEDSRAAKRRRVGGPAASGSAASDMPQAGGVEVVMSDAAASGQQPQDAAASGQQTEDAAGAIASAAEQQEECAEEGELLEAVQAVVLGKGAPCAVTLEGLSPFDCPGRWVPPKGSIKALLRDIAGNPVDPNPQMVPVLSAKGAKLMTVTGAGLGAEARTVPFTLEAGKRWWEAPEFALITGAAGQAELQVMFKWDPKVKRAQQTPFDPFTTTLTTLPFNRLVQSLRLVEPQALGPQQSLHLVAGMKQDIRLKAFTPLPRPEGEACDVYSTPHPSLKAVLSGPGVDPQPLRVEASTEAGFHVELKIDSCNADRPYQLMFNYSEQRQDVKSLMTPQERQALPSLTIPVIVTAAERHALHLELNPKKALTTQNIAEGGKNVLTQNVAMYYVDRYGNLSSNPSPAGERLVLELRPAADSPPSTVAPPRLEPTCREVVFQADGKALAHRVTVEVQSGMHYPTMPGATWSSMVLVVLGSDGETILAQHPVVFYDTASKEAQQREAIRQQQERREQQVQVAQAKQAEVDRKRAEHGALTHSLVTLEQNIRTYQTQAQNHVNSACRLLPLYHQPTPREHLKRLIAAWSASWSPHHLSQASQHSLENTAQSTLRDIINTNRKVRGRIVDLVKVNDANLAHLLSWYLKKNKMTTLVVDDDSVLRINYHGRHLMRSFTCLPLEVADRPNTHTTQQKLPHTRLSHSALNSPGLQDLLRQGNPSYAFQHVVLTEAAGSDEDGQKILHYAFGSLILMNDFDSAYAYRKTLVNARPRIHCPPILAIQTGEVVSGTVGGEGNQLVHIATFSGLNNVMFSPDLHGMHVAQRHLDDAEVADGATRNTEAQAATCRQRVGVVQQELTELEQQLKTLWKLTQPRVAPPLAQQPGASRQGRQAAAPANRRPRGR